MFVCLHVHVGTCEHLWLCVTMCADRGNGTSIAIILQVSPPFPGACLGEVVVLVALGSIVSCPPSTGIASASYLASLFNVDSGIEHTPPCLVVRKSWSCLLALSGNSEIILRSVLLFTC